MRPVLICLILFLTLYSCKSVFKTSPYNSYKDKLKQAGLLETLMGKQWVSAGEKVVQAPQTELSYPFRDEIFFRKEEPAAIAYRIAYVKSNKLKIKLKARDEDNGGVFFDLFKEDASLESHLITDTTLVFDDNNDQQLILRLQPRLLSDTYVSLEIIMEAKLGFPVKNATNKSIQSFWGDGRDAGARKHEGIDIFAKRGTPVLAVENGTIFRVQSTAIGGKVVWQRLGLFGQNIYYAHLDSQLVADGQTVKKGEVIGLVGNTGNAIGTSPHLHFGIYTNSGAIDPIDYVWIKDTVPGRLKADTSWLGKEVRLSNRNETLPARVMSISTKNISVISAKGELEQIDKLEKLSSAKARFNLPDSAFVYNRLARNAVPIGRLSTKETYRVLGFTADSIYIEQQKLKGWVTRN